MNADAFPADLSNSSQPLCGIVQALLKSRCHAAVYRCSPDLQAFAVQASCTVQGDAQPDQAALEEQLAAAAQHAEALGADLASEREAHAASRRQLLDLQRQSAKRPATPVSAPHSPAAAGEPAAQTHAVRVKSVSVTEPRSPAAAGQTPSKLHVEQFKVYCMQYEVHQAIQI